MDPGQFEVLVAELLENLGYEDVKVTGQSGDTSSSDYRPFA
jgi:restriction endonuclease Mrr